MEKCLAARTAALYAICVGATCEDFIKNLQGDFASCISGSMGTTAAAEVIRAWATGAFISGEVAESVEFIAKCVQWAGLPTCNDDIKQAIVTSIALCTSALPELTVTEIIIPK